MSQMKSLRAMSDKALILCLNDCVGAERRATAQLLAALAEFDVRRLYMPAGFRSLFSYCVHHLHLSERAAYGRIEAARLVRRFPIVLDLIAGNRVSLTAVARLARHLTESNHRTVLEEAAHKTVSQVDAIVARLSPRPDAVAMVRRILPPRVAPSDQLPATGGSSPVAPESTPVSPVPASPLTPPPPLTTPLTSTTPLTTAAEVVPMPASVPASESAAAPGSEMIPGFALTPVSARAINASRDVVTPLSPERFRVQFTVSGETRAKLRMAQDLLRHSLPSGDLAAIFDRALSVLLADIEKRKLAIVANPRQSKKAAKASTTRHIPAAVKRAVWARDKGRCAFVGKEGRCRERGALELHHVKPFAAGGTATVKNIELRCRAHNAHEADTYFGARGAR